jgi:hypothetical protein
MLHESSSPSAASAEAAIPPSPTAPETEIRVDERVKQPPSAAQRGPTPAPMPEEDLVGSPGETAREDGYRDEPVKQPPPKDEIPPDVRALLGEAHLLPGEDRATYEALLTELAQTRAPKDTVEWLNVKDMADAAWEGERLKRLKTRLLTQRVEAELCRRLEGAVAKEGLEPQACRNCAQALSRGWARNDPKVIKKVLRLLPDGIDLTLVTAQALLQGSETIDILERMLTTALKRRQQAAKDIETRRLLFARTWRLEHVFPKSSWCM